MSGWMDRQINRSIGREMSKMDIYTQTDIVVGAWMHRKTDTLHTGTCYLGFGCSVFIPGRVLSFLLRIFLISRKATA